jgi:type II secretory pathway pseudopilin PulG
MQQINLYLPEFQPSREPMRAIHALVSIVVVAALLMLFSVTSNLQYKKLQKQIADEQQAQSVLQKQLDALSTKKPASNGASLDEEIEKLQKDLQRRQQILDLISNQSLGNDKGFSSQLHALAKASLATVSIETFSLQKGGSYVELGGKTTAADQIPLYLQKLHEEASFAKVAVGVLHVQRDEKDSALLVFSLTKPVPEKATDNAKGSR